MSNLLRKKAGGALPTRIRKRSGSKPYGDAACSALLPSSLPHTFPTNPSHRKGVSKMGWEVREDIWLRAWHLVDMVSLWLSSAGFVSVTRAASRVARLSPRLRRTPASRPERVLSNCVNTVARSSRLVGSCIAPLAVHYCPLVSISLRKPLPLFRMSNGGLRLQPKGLFLIPRSFSRGKISRKKLPLVLHSCSHSRPSDASVRAKHSFSRTLATKYVYRKVLRYDLPA